MIYVVTGGSRGIGAGIVAESVAQGHDVAFTYLTNAAQAEQVQARARQRRPGCRCCAYRLDVRDPAAVERVGNTILDDFGTVHVVVNNAAINRDSLCATMTDDEWHDVIATNLNGPFYVSRHFLMELVANRFGRIINISSVSAGGASGQANYAAAKAGLVGLTRTLAREYGRWGITANIVIPGYFDTEMTRETMTDAFREFWSRNCPIPRVGDPAEIAQVVAFLASPAAGYVTGASISVTGGLDHAA